MTAKQDPGEAADIPCRDCGTAGSNASPELCAVCARREELDEADRAEPMTAWRIEADSDGLVYREPTLAVAEGREADPHLFRVNSGRTEAEVEELGREIVRRWNAHAALVAALQGYVDADEDDGPGARARRRAADAALAAAGVAP